MLSDDVLDVVGLYAASSHINFGDTSSTSEFLGARFQAPIYKDVVAERECSSQWQGSSELLPVEDAHVQSEGSSVDSNKYVDLSVHADVKSCMPLIKVHNR